MEQPVRSLERHPPIITKSDSGGGAVLRSYIEGLAGSNLSQLAAEEATRIEPYLDALGVRTDFGRSAGHPMLKAIKNIITYRLLPAGNPGNIESGPLEKGGMKALFTKAAADTGNVIASEFAILPENFDHFDEIIYLASHGRIKGAHKVVKFGETSTKIGFIQCIQNGGKSSISFPVLGLDPGILRDLDGVDSAPVLQGLQQIFTATNHDMLHHLTNPVISSSSVVNHAKKVTYANKMRDLIESRFNRGDGEDDHPGSYESWALISHAATWREMKGTQTEFDFQTSVDRFFDALSDLDREMKTLGRASAERHRVIDYFSTLGGFALMRIYGFDDPLMKEALGRMESLCLKPAKIVEDSGLDPLLSNMEKRREIYSDLVKEPAFLTGYHLYRAGRAISDHNARFGKDIPGFEAPRLKKHLLDNGSADVSLAPEEAMEIAKELQAFARLVASESVENRDKHYFEWVMLDAVSDAFHKNAEYTAPYRNLLPAAFQDYVRTMGEGLQPSRNLDARSKIKDNESGDSMLDKVLINYDLSGRSLLDMDHDSPYIVAKRLQMIRMAPEIAFLNSPANPDSPLGKIRKNAKIIDEGIVHMLGKEL